MRKEAVKYLCEGSFIRQCISWLDRKLGNLARKRIMKNIPIENNKIVFMTYNNKYICNPKYIAEEIIRKKLPYQLIWIVDKKGPVPKNFPAEIKCVRRESYDAYFHMSSAKVWVDNSINFFWQPVYKKKSQFYIETWHGSMGLKRVGKDDVQNKRWLRSAAACSKNTDFCISNSKFEDMVFNTTHWPNTPSLSYGHPRNDILFYQPDSIEYADCRSKVIEFFNNESKNNYHISDNDKLLLYAPTWRDDGRTDCYNINFDLLINSLEERFGGSWKVLFRMHFHDRKKIVNISPEMQNRVIPATTYSDMQELMLAADAGITDYSSWACDFVLTRKPLFIYATDLSKYNTERGLYYPLETTPFPIATDNDELSQRIISFDEKTYLCKCKEFLADKGCYEDGHAAERVVAKIQELIELH